MDSLKYEKIQKLEQIGELLNAKTISSSEFDYLKAKIIKGESFQLPSNGIKPPEIKFERIRAAGYATRDIFRCIIWQLPLGFIFGFVINFTPEYTKFCFIGYFITEFVIVVTILRRLSDLGNHLVMANKPLQQ